jgi:hypothetical protein
MARTDAALAPAHHDEASRISVRIQHVAHPVCILELPTAEYERIGVGPLEAAVQALTTEQR